MIYKKKKQVRSTSQKEVPDYVPLMTSDTIRFPSRFRTYRVVCDL